MSDLTPDDVEITIAYPHMCRQIASLVLGRTVVKYRRYVPSPQHQLCGEPLLETHRTPRDSLGHRGN
jgi:hypothetical protein